MTHSSKKPERTSPDTPEAQSKRFIDKARELGCDEDEAVLEDRLRRIVPKPKKEEGNSGHD